MSTHLQALILRDITTREDCLQAYHEVPVCNSAAGKEEQLPPFPSRHCVQQLERMLQKYIIVMIHNRRLVWGEWWYEIARVIGKHWECWTLSDHPAMDAEVKVWRLISCLPPGDLFMGMPGTAVVVSFGWSAICYLQLYLSEIALSNKEILLVWFQLQISFKLAQ